MKALKDALSLDSGPRIGMSYHVAATASLCERIYAGATTVSALTAWSVVTAFVELCTARESGPSGLSVRHTSHVRCPSRSSPRCEGQSTLVDLEGVRRYFQRTYVTASAPKS